MFPPALFCWSLQALLWVLSSFPPATFLQGYLSRSSVAQSWKMSTPLPKNNLWSREKYEGKTFCPPVHGIPIASISNLKATCWEFTPRIQNEVCWRIVLQMHIIRYDFKSRRQYCSLAFLTSGPIQSPSPWLGLSLSQYGLCLSIFSGGKHWVGSTGSQWCTPSKMLNFILSGGQWSVKNNHRFFFPDVLMEKAKKTYLQNPPGYTLVLLLLQNSCLPQTSHTFPWQKGREILLTAFPHSSVLWHQSEKGDFFLHRAAFKKSLTRLDDATNSHCWLSIDA